jgi:flavin reductase (DIM6/NTAB) family NADH-FMN oxidoreductase RutF
MAYLGNVSYAVDCDKVAHSGLHAIDGASTPILAELPVHFDCKVIDRVYLGTHLMFLGEVERVFVRPDVTPENPLAWCPWPVVADVAHEEP